MDPSTEDFIGGAELPRRYSCTVAADHVVGDLDVGCAHPAQEKR